MPSKKYSVYTMETVVSGIRSTGNLHLGNYFGALRNFTKMQYENRCFFFIADLHSLTTHPKPDDFHGNVRQVVAEYLAAGLDPEVATLFVQSHVPEICELYVILNMIAYKGELERTASFKEKIRKHPDNVNAGLLTYPVLMAADILVHKANKVPVGKDQEQHLEVARVLARRFNNMYGKEVFPEPTAYNFGANLVKIPGLDGSGKMGKSEGNGIYLIDDAKTIQKKVMKAVTDSGPTEPNSPMPESIQNIFRILEVVSTADTVQYFRDKYNSCEIRYGDLKKQLAEDICKITLPIRERILAIAADKEYVRKVVESGAERARESAAKTLKEVKEVVGFKSFNMKGNEPVTENGSNISKVNPQLTELVSHQDGKLSYQDNTLTCTLKKPSTIHISIKEERLEAYSSSLDFIICLLTSGFPKSYEISFSSKKKEYLPIKGLPKRGVNKFFANAVKYPSLYGKIEQYALSAMNTHEWYTNLNNKDSAMPSTFAVFALGLVGEQYFSLVKKYMETCDPEHSGIQTKFTSAFVEKYGITKSSFAVFIACILSSQWYPMPKSITKAFANREALEILLDFKKNPKGYEVWDRLLYSIFGKDNSKIKKQFPADCSDLLKEILEKEQR